MRLIILSLISMMAVNSWGQAGIGTNTPDPSAALEIQSTSKGILLPRLTETQMLSIANPAEGLIIFNTNTNSFWYYKNGTGWRNLALSIPYAQSINSTGTIFQITNSSTTNTLPVMNIVAASGNAIYGLGGDTYPGVFGENNSNGKGVSGLNTGTGHGVHARGMDGTAIFADIPTGTGTAARFKQPSPLGKAMEIEGKLRIFGANTNPNSGYYLTCRDNSGVAAWQPVPTTNEKVSFEARGMAAGGANVLANGYPGSKFHPGSEVYDPGNDFNVLNQVPSSTFIAPANGLYNLHASITFPAVSTHYYEVTIQLERNGVTKRLCTVSKYNGTNILGSVYLVKSLTLPLSTTTHLQQGDRIWLNIEFSKEDGTTATFNTAAEYQSLTGTLVYAD